MPCRGVCGATNLRARGAACARFDTVAKLLHNLPVKPPLGRKVTTAEADHCRTLKAIGSAGGRLLCAPDRLQWVRNGLTLTTADDYNSKVLSERGGAGQRVGYTKTGPRASPNRITQNHNQPQIRTEIEKNNDADCPACITSHVYVARAPSEPSSVSPL